MPMAPGGTPDEIVNLLQRDVHQAIDTPELRIVLPASIAPTAATVRLADINEALAAFGLGLTSDREDWRRYRELTRLRGLVGCRS